MHGNVDGAGQQRLLDLFREQALAADLLQRPVGSDQGAVIAGGLDDHDLAGIFGKSVGGHQAAARLESLGERERRAARADPEG